MKTQRCLLIFGMHRSGTSAFTGLLEKLGIPMGQLMEAAYDNPKGFYENKQVVKINEEILRILGQTWDTPHEMPTNWLDIRQVQDLKQNIKALFQKEFKHQAFFALKDPRFSLTLPLWKAVLKELSIEIEQFIILRHPFEIADSLYKRNHFSKSRSLALWTKYMINAERNSRGAKRQFINYETILTQPIELVKSLNLQNHPSINDFTKLENFINPNLRHHQNQQVIKDELLDNVHKAIADLIINPENKESQSRIDTIKNSSAYKTIIYPDELIAKLLIDNGQGYFEKTPNKKAIQADTKQLVFDFAKKKQPKRLQFYPANALVALQIKKLQLKTTNGKLLPIRHFVKTPLLEHQNHLIFDKEGFIEIDLSKISENIENCSIELDYLNFKEAVHKDIKWINLLIQEELADSKQHTKSSTIYEKDLKPTAFWLEFIKTAFQYPGRFLKQLNGGNFRKLKRALANESPAMILLNLKNFLRRGGSEVTVNESTSINTSGLLNRQHASIYKTGNKEKLGKILYIFQDLPDFDQSSGGKRATRILELLAEGFEVYVFTLGTKPKKYIEVLANIGIEVLSMTAAKKVKKQIPDFTAIIYSIYRIYHESKDFIKLYPKAKIIIDTVDVNWLREERSIGIWEGLTTARVAKNKQKEIEAYQAVDLIWAVTAQDKAAILEEIPAADVRIVSNVHEAIIEQYEDNHQNTLLFIGSYHHYPNISAVKKLALDIFPIVKAAIPNAALIIAGSNAPAEVIQLADQAGITYRGFVEETEMDDLYKNTFLSVSPLLAGAGIKGKICEAIAYKTPVVTNDIGNEGIDLIHEEEGLILPIEEMADSIIKALRREYDFESITKKAQSKLFQLVGPSVVKQRMLQSFFPEVSICIVTWNKLDLLKKCIQSIEKYTRYPNYKLLIYSNACTDGTQAYLKELAAQKQYIIPFLAEENEVFVKPNNKMMQYFPKNEVILLNNDTTVTEGWLMALYKAAYNKDNYGIVGSKILYPDGRLQEFGAEIYKDGTGHNIGKGDNPNLERYNKIKEVSYVSGCAMYIKRSTIDSIGVFDEQFHPCYFEDSDYCYRAKKQGLKTAVIPQSIIYHEEGATAGTDTDAGFKQYQSLNRKKFLAKHKSKLRN